MIQGLVVLFVGADVLILYAVRPPEAATTAASRGGTGRMIRWVSNARRPSSDRVLAWIGIAFGLIAFWVALPPLKVRTEWIPPVIGLFGITLRHQRADPRQRPPARLVRDRDQRPRDRARSPRHPLERGPPRPGDRLVGAHGRDAPLRDAARLRRDGRHLLRAQRRREHRPRGDDALRRLLRDPRRRQVQLVGSSACSARRSRARRSRSSTPSSRSTFAPTRSSAAPRSTSWRSGSPATSSSTSTAARGRRRTSPGSRTCTCPSSRTGTSSGPCSATST